MHLARTCDERVYINVLRIYCSTMHDMHIAESRHTVSDRVVVCSSCYGCASVHKGFEGAVT